MALPSLESGTYKKFVGESKSDDIIEPKLPELVLKESIKEEKWHQTTIQVGIPFLIAGCGTIAAGIILGHVKVRK